MIASSAARRRERDHRHLEERYDGPFAAAWRRALRAGGAMAHRRAVAATDAALIDGLARDCVRARASARRRLASGAGDRRDESILSSTAAHLRRLRRAGLAAIAIAWR